MEVETNIQPDIVSSKENEFSIEEIKVQIEDQLDLENSTEDLRQLMQLKSTDSKTAEKLQEAINRVELLLRDKTPQELAAQIREDDDFDPKDIFFLTLAAPREIKLLVRSALDDDRAIARNQDLVLPHIRGAVSGNKDSRAFVEKSRFTLEAYVPEWAQDAIESQKNADWRTKTVKIEDRYQAIFSMGFKKLIPGKTFTFTLPSLTEMPDDQYDERKVLLSYQARVKTLEIFETESRKQIPLLGSSRRSHDTIHSFEYHHGVRRLSSPTEIGRFLRKAAIREGNQIFAAILIEDVVLQYDLPLSDEGKLSLWEDIKGSPWNIAQHPVIREGNTIITELEHQGLEGEELTIELERILFDPKAFRSYLKQRNAALKKHQLEQYRNTEKETETSSSVKVKTAPITRSIRLELQAAIEVHYHSSIDSKIYSRRFAKLINGDAEIFKSVLLSIYAGKDLAQVTDELRANRPLSVLKQISSHEEEQLTAERSDTTADTETTLEKTLIFTPHALKRMRDGVLRHAAHNALDKLIETPELVDRKRIANTNAWELRVSKPSVRVYFSYLGEDQILVINVGKKTTQVRDISNLSSIQENFIT